ncbi:hypothetical protein GCM10017783_26140 [Deinococcus piscis]|uniref:Uncharacterized protein n=1 Tax=Deinococcus piscis TaxID=394230 RepID=A0ABQ3KDC5_9DEIO|nr:hypothetical protein GCM10017783_26140 [Deinococcus piscis]
MKLSPTEQREQERKLRKLGLWLGILGSAAGLLGRVWDLFHRR